MCSAVLQRQTMSRMLDGLLAQIVSWPAKCEALLHRLQVRAAYNPQRQIVNNNFNLIKAFIHHWGPAVPLPLPALLSLLGAVPAKPSSGPPDARAKRRAAEQRCVAMKLLAAGVNCPYS